MKEIPTPSFILSRREQLSAVPISVLAFCPKTNGLLKKKKFILTSSLNFQNWRNVTYIFVGQNYV